MVVHILLMACEHVSQSLGNLVSHPFSMDKLRCTFIKNVIFRTNYVLACHCSLLVSSPVLGLRTISTGGESEFIHFRLSKTAVTAASVQLGVHTCCSVGGLMGFW